MIKALKSSEATKEIIKECLLQLELLLSTNIPNLSFTIVELFEHILPFLKEPDALRLCNAFDKADNFSHWKAIFIPKLLKSTCQERNALRDKLIKYLENVGCDMPDSILFSYLKNLVDSPLDLLNSELFVTSILKLVPTRWLTDPSFPNSYPQLIYRIISSVEEPYLEDSASISKFGALCVILSDKSDKSTIPTSIRWKAIWHTARTQNTISSNPLVGLCRLLDLQLEAGIKCASCGLTPNEKSLRKNNLILGSGSSSQSYKIVAD